VILVDAQGVGCARPDKVLFAGLSVTVSTGDRIGVVGINGTGKSTLLRVLAGTQQPEEGTVRRGRGVRIGMLDQTPDLGSGTVRDAVGEEWRGEAMLDRLGMGSMLDADTSTLSGGQAKRVALARLLVHEHDLLILDEPTNHLDLDAVAALAATTIVLIMDMAFLVVFVVMIAILAGWLALIPLTIIAAMAAAGFILQRKVVTAAQDAQADFGLQQTLLVESLAGMETLKSMAGEGGMISRWHSLAEIGSHSQQRLRNISSLAVGLAQVFQQVSTIALIIGGYYLFASGEITMGAIIAIVMLASRSLAPAAQIAFLLTRGRQAHATLDSIERLFEGKDERRLGGSLAPSRIEKPRIQLDNVEFRYPGVESSALSNVTLDIRPGERIAVVGRVASGKSTLGRVLCGLYQPTDGAVLIGGIDSRQYRPQQVREALRFVGQDAALFTGSVKDNLALGRRDASDERLIEAMRATGADTFLARDAGGFDRAVGEGGRSLSGGQRAFLALTRALVSPSQLLFLDEPTGAMDSQTEKHFVERLGQSLTADQTLVIATHRPALFALCQRLIVLDKGRIVADGPIQEVIAASGAAGSIAQ
jgi:ATP-binding cassette subfamily C protein LapB